ncbi:MAG TPA: DUF2975 domain-containing protein [Balneolaceae bacterium]|nr:DUF2975 domain-containing protein [Balneolaceae bacterium]
MNLPNKFSILVWACNLTLVILAIIIVASGYYYTLVPGLVGLDTNFEGATKYSTRISQNFLSDYYNFERVIDTEKGIDTEGYYFASLRNLYKVPISDSVMVDVSKINSELSSSEINLMGLQVKNLTVSKSAGKLPVRLIAPAIPLSRNEYKSMAQLNVVSFILLGVYTFAFVWFLRKFVSGLRKPDFFNRANSRYLYITASLVTIAPFLMWGWISWVRPDLHSEFLIENAEAVNASSSLPAALLIFGVILLAIAWCFDQGVKLQKEQELTI